MAFRASRNERLNRIGEEFARMCYYNLLRRKQKSLFTSLMDKKQPTAPMVSSPERYNDSSPEDEKLILKHEHLLFYKMQEKNFPI